MKSATESIILGSTNLGEADKIITFFSLDRGRLRGVAKNARKSFRRFGAGLELFTHSRLHLYEREHQDLIRIESAEILTQHFTLSCDLERTAAGSAMLELVRELAPEAERNPSVFLLLGHMLNLLETSDDPAALLRIFEIRLLSLFGYQPKLDRCLSCGRVSERRMVFYGPKGGVLCPSCLVSDVDAQMTVSPGAVGFYYHALRMDLDKLTRLRPSAEIMRELDQALAAHTVHILGRRLRSSGFFKLVCGR